MKQIRILAAVLFMLPMMAAAQAGPGYAFTDLGAFSRVAAINNAGQVLGYSYTADLSEVHATIWSGTSATDLGTLGGGDSFAYGLNSAGQVVGYSTTTGFAASHATLWNGTSITDLNDLLDPATVSNDWVLVEAYGINDSGSIVGYAENGLTGDGHGFVLSALPEPESYALMLAGLDIVGAAVCRRNLNC